MSIPIVEGYHDYSRKNAGLHAGVLVTGDKVEMAVFWAIWQTELWPGWMDVLEHPHAVSHREAVRRIRDTGELLLADSSDRYEDATTRAIQRCKLLGIVVE